MRTKVAMTDKDLTERTVIKKIPPNCNLRLCRFYTLRTFNGEITCDKLGISPAERDHAKTLFEAMSYCQTRGEVFGYLQRTERKYPCSAEKVRQSIAPNLSSKDINSDAVIEEIRKAKSAQSRSTVPEMNEENDAEEIELSVNTALDIEPVVYELDANGILTTTNIIEVEEGLPGPSAALLCCRVCAATAGRLNGNPSCKRVYHFLICSLQTDYLPKSFKTMLMQESISEEPVGSTSGVSPT
ncbi:hypothetical protein JTE90_014071 [Oedothorax gibbosus]|uniref:Uncharacterized protein n=1 Tax=Oedothorax gibbosus TaxID=931172 RepID=A0AAV6TSN9_9ARAC|nr:hypothetical protein JTE90_014071 [Oedothorax gibbosus]